MDMRPYKHLRIKTTLRNKDSNVKWVTLIVRFHYTVFSYVVCMYISVCIHSSDKENVSEDEKQDMEEAENDADKNDLSDEVLCSYCCIYITSRSIV